MTGGIGTESAFSTPKLLQNFYPILIFHVSKAPLDAVKFSLLESATATENVKNAQGGSTMNWVRAIIGLLGLWPGIATGATLTWNANSEPDVAGYRVYQCSLTPCGPGSGHQTLLATLGKVTSFNIG